MSWYQILVEEAAWYLSLVATCGCDWKETMSGSMMEDASEQVQVRTLTLLFGVGGRRTSLVIMLLVWR